MPRAGNPPAESRGLLSFRRAVFAWLTHAQWFRWRILDSPRHLSGALELGRLGRARRDSFRLLFAVVLSARLLRRSHERKEPHAARHIATRKVDARVRGCDHIVDGHRLHFLYAAICRLLPERARSDGTWASAGSCCPGEARGAKWKCPGSRGGKNLTG